jgi:hypothetical protein
MEIYTYNTLKVEKFKKIAWKREQNALMHFMGPTSSLCVKQLQNISQDVFVEKSEL